MLMATKTDISAAKRADVARKGVYLLLLFVDAR